MGTSSLTLREAFIDSLSGLWLGVADLAPKIILAVLLLIVGWLIAVILEHAIIHVARALKLDNLLQHTGVDELVQRSGFEMSAAHFLGGLVKWFFILLFLQFSVDVVGLVQVNVFLGQVLSYLPQVIIAVVILFAGSIIAEFTDNFVTGSARAAHVEMSSSIGKLAKGFIWVFAVFAALIQLGIGVELILALLYGLIGMLALAGGLAFGLGGRDTAADVLKRISATLKDKPRIERGKKFSR